MLYLLGNANETVNIKKRRIWPIVRSCSRSRWVRTGKSSQARQEETQSKNLWNKPRSPALGKQSSWLPSLDVSSPNSWCDIAGCDRFSGPHTLGENLSKGQCNPVQTWALGFLLPGVQEERNYVRIGWNETQPSLVLSKLAEVWFWDIVWHLVLVWLLAGLQLNVWPWMNNTWGSFSASSFYPSCCFAINMSGVICCWKLRYVCMEELV